MTLAGRPRDRESEGVVGAAGVGQLDDILGRRPLADAGLGGRERRHDPVRVGIGGAGVPWRTRSPCTAEVAPLSPLTVTAKPSSPVAAKGSEVSVSGTLTVPPAATLTGEPSSPDQAHPARRHSLDRQGVVDGARRRIRELDRVGRRRARRDGLSRRARGR